MRGFFVCELSIVILGCESGGNGIEMLGDDDVRFERGDADLDLSDVGVVDLLLQFLSHNSGVINEPVM